MNGMACHVEHSDGGSTSPLSVPVSVIVPTFNRARLLEQALESILAQSAPAQQVLVVDDGSTDGTAEMVKRFAGRIDYVRKENGGKAAALNLGLSLAREPFIWIFDDDDIAEPGALANLYAPLVADPAAGFSFGLCDRFTGEWPSPCSEPYPMSGAATRAELHLQAMEGFCIWQGGLLVRKASYDAVGPFRTDLIRSQDYEMILRLTRRFEGRFVPFVMFHQRHHDGDRGTAAVRMRMGQVDAQWKKYDQIIFREIYGSHLLSEYLTSLPGEMAGRTTATALMQRATIMARRGLWDLALDDLRRVTCILTELGVTAFNDQETRASRMIFQKNARSALKRVDDIRRLRRVVKMMPRTLRVRFAANLIWPIPYRLRTCGGSRQPGAEFVQALVDLCGAIGPSAAIALAAEKLGRVRAPAGRLSIS